MSCSVVRKYSLQCPPQMYQKNNERKRTAKNMQSRAIKNSGLCSYSQGTEPWNIPSLKVEGSGNICPVFRIAMDQSLLHASHSFFFKSLYCGIPISVSSQYVEFVGAKDQQCLLRSQVSVWVKTTTGPDIYYKILGFNWYHDWMRLLEFL